MAKTHTKVKASMFDLSLEVASKIYAAASIGAIALTALAVVAGVLTYWSSSEISRHSDRRLAESQAIAEQARQSANRLEVETENLKNKNLELQIELERQQRERLKLQQSLGPRTFSNAQTILLQKGLHGSASEATVLIHYAPGKETSEYANQIANAFANGGVQVKLGELNAIIVGASDTGLQITFCRGPGAGELKPVLLEMFPEAETIDDNEDTPSAFSGAGLGRLFNSEDIAAYIHVKPKQAHI